ncbi:MAG: type IV pilin [Haloplanus sp.]
MSDRAQSEVVGTILLVGLVVVTVGVVGTATLGPVTSMGDGPRAAITGTVGTDAVALNHQGGDSLPSAELRLILRVDGTKRAYAWRPTHLSGSDETFDPGDRWRNASTPYGSRDVVTLMLVHAPSNTVLFRTETNPSAPERAVGDGGAVDAADSEGTFVRGDGDADRNAERRRRRGGRRRR